MSNVSYSAVVLDERSRQKLIKYFEDLIPNNYDIIAHHMTINLGEIDFKYEKYLGLPIKLKVEDFAIDNKVAAVGVSGFPSKNEKPHITLAVNKQVGGKSVMSNKLTDWSPLKRPIKIVGKVEEVPFNF